LLNQGVLRNIKKIVNVYFITNFRKIATPATLTNGISYGFTDDRKNDTDDQKKDDY
jgi:hypothetical protein